MSTPPGFPARLVWWRKRRGLSQLDLALAADVSQRHVSFLELDRTRPSREMVLRLAAAMDVPLRHSNELLLAAGFAPVWNETAFDAQTLAPVRDALDFMLQQQEPFPAVVVDRRWNLLLANQGAAALVQFLVGPVEPGTAVNLADALVAPDVLRPHLVNWAEVVRFFLRSVEADAAADGSEQTAALLRRLLGYDGVRAALAVPGASGAGRAGAADAFREEWRDAAAVHHDRDAGHATGHHAAGITGRKLFPAGRGDARAVPRLGRLRQMKMLATGIVTSGSAST